MRGYPVPCSVIINMLNKNLAYLKSWADESITDVDHIMILQFSCF